MFKNSLNVNREFLLFVSETIQEKYDVSSDYANELVFHSKVSKMIYTDPNFIMHYDVEDLADEIMSDAMVR